MRPIPDDLLLAVLARRLDFVSAHELNEALALRTNEPTRSADVILGELGVLTEKVRRALGDLIAAVRENLSESILADAQGFEEIAQATTAERVAAAHHADSGGVDAASETIDPLAPPPPGQDSPRSAISSPDDSTDDVVPSTVPYPNSEDDHASVFSIGGGAALDMRLPAESLSAEQRYRLIRPMAEGGLGQVLLARDEVFGREVALKHIRSHIGADVRMQNRFLLEARITGNLEHPGIVGGDAIGHDTAGRPFYVMRLIRGETLRDAIRRYHGGEGSFRSDGERTLALRKLINRVIAACNAITFAHSRGVLHRDIKPANIMIGKYGETLVVDWGLAKRLYKFVGSEDHGETHYDGDLNDPAMMTLSGMVVGTPAYMSPEQAEGRGDLMEPTSDVYSLGATLYDVLTGSTPFQGKRVQDVILEVQKGQFEAPIKVHTSVDRALEAICLKAMAHAPEDRCATARAMADDLERWLAGEPVTAFADSTASALSRGVSRRPRVVIRGLVAVIGVLFVALAGLGLALAMRLQAR